MTESCVINEADSVNMEDHYGEDGTFAPVYVSKTASLPTELVKSSSGCHFFPIKTDMLLLNSCVLCPYVGVLFPFPCAER